MGSPSYNTNLDSIPKLCPDEVHIGALLGSGAFASVYQVFPRQDRDHSSFQNMTKSCKIRRKPFTCEIKLKDNNNDRSSTGLPKSECLFALKRMRKVDDSNQLTIKHHKNELLNEVEILSRLPPHSNIIQLYAVSSNFADDPMNGFLILQYLPETLDVRMKSWRRARKLQKKTNPVKRRLLQGIHGVLGNRHEKNEQSARVSRVCIGIAEALSFLHHNGIIHRDLKASNIGFDDHGNVRLYDFNLARMITDEDVDRELTACVGSLPYMAPEVALGHKYNFSADVHSFGILMYEVCTLKKAFPMARNINDLFRTVFIGSCRPSLRAVQSNATKKLLEACWDPNPECRPSFPSVLAELKDSRNNDSKPTKR